MSDFYIGMDIGGTSVRTAVYDRNEKSISDIIKLPFKRLNSAQQEVETNICGLIHLVMESNNKNIKNLKGIGISAPALLDRKTGDVADWPNNRLWNNFPLTTFLHDTYHTPLIIEDDANSAAMGEYIQGAGRGYQNLAYISIGTGVGCGIILNNDLFKGENGWAGEVGHIVLEKDGPQCKCGMRGCLQSLVCGPALIKMGKAAAQERGIAPDSINDLNDLIPYVNQNAQWAIDIFEQAAYYLARMVHILLMTLDIPLVTIGGGVAQVGDPILNPLNRLLKKYLLPTGRKIDVRLNQLGDNSGVIGSLNLIYKNVKNRNLF